MCCTLSCVVQYNTIKICYDYYNENKVIFRMVIAAYPAIVCTVSCGYRLSRPISGNWNHNSTPGTHKKDGHMTTFVWC